MQVRIMIFSLIPLLLHAQDPAILTIGRLRYTGGDWYSNPSSLPNLLRFFRKKTGIEVEQRDVTVSLLDNSYKQVPILYFTGHGKLIFSTKEKENLRNYLKQGGFLFADDNFGLDKWIRKELNTLFPGSRLVPLSWNHPLFKYPFSFEKTGPPKIHKHYGGAPIAYGLFYEGRLVAFYLYNSDLGDGWEDPDIHGDPPSKRIAALKFGCNVLFYALHHGLL
ncbi:MAG: DUF4159 domain-containing protein [Candidatus Hydrogenedentota bacterium]|nr:MAG: DUF4159 domain-containing protein [Candidatus Hydrogenedentota bacterium]